MGKKLVFGHKNPDTDTICSTLVYASLKQQLGEAVEAVRLGEMNRETLYVLEYLNIAAPRLIEKVDASIEAVIMVDHNEFQQSVDNIQDVHIAEVIDHHRISNFETSEPLYFRAEPVGCTATILKKIFNEKNIEISRENAVLMLSAIISDTLLFKSPTCTPEDEAAAEALAEIAEVELEAYGLDMLKAGTDLGDKSAAELITMDAKEFTMGQAKVEIAQINTVDIESIYEKQTAFETVIETKNLDLFLLVVTDILNSNSEVLALGPASENVEKAFDVALAKNRALLEGVVSRKKQIVTSLSSTF